MNTIYLSIGSNTDPEANLKRIVQLLRDKLKVMAISPVYESADAKGGDQVYLNAAVSVQTSLDPEALKIGILEPLEDRLERESSGVFVTADVDIVLVNDETLTYLGREIPDAGVTRHAFVAVPLADIAPDYVHPVTGQTLREITGQVDAGTLRPRPDVNL